MILQNLKEYRGIITKGGVNYLLRFWCISFMTNESLQSIFSIIDLIVV